MTRQATQRLLDAAGQLDPADRALLSLLINHGLGDEAMARMMHLSPAAMASRREQLIEHLSASLGLPPASVDEALEELVASARSQRAIDEPAVANGGRAQDSALTVTNGGPPLSTDPSLPVADTSSPIPDRALSVSRRRRRGIAAAALALGLLLVVALITALSPGKAKHPANPVARATKTALTRTAAASTPLPPAARGRRDLAVLAGGPAGVTGSATVLGPPAHPRLALSASGMPGPGRGHYQVWLYNSILDAVPLVRLRAPSDAVTVALPPGYRRYRWLDVSLQPAGSADHSGESILRVALGG